MAVGFKRDETGEAGEAAIEELRSRLESLTPSTGLLVGAAQRLPGAEGGLARRELNALIRGLERVWHIMRLLRLLADFFGGELFFGGGSVLNYVYMVGYGEPPRLTFDLDATWHRRVTSKRVILARMVEFNRWLTESGLTLRIPVGGGRAAELFLVEYDVEKDYFPELLSLRVPVITRYDGELFHRFLGIKDYRVITMLRRVFRETLGVENPRIDYVRFEVSLNPEGMPRVEAVLEDMFGWRARAWITELEYQLAAKVRYKVGRDFGADLPYNIHDILKAVLDLRLLDHVDIAKVSEYTGPVDLETVEANLRAVAVHGSRLWERNYHYILVRRRYRLEDLIERVKRRLAGREPGRREGPEDT